MTLHTEAQLARRHLDDFVETYKDYDGTPTTVVDDAYDDAHSWAVMLEDLTQLSVPLTRTEWFIDMRMGLCPCTLALQRYQESME